MELFLLYIITRLTELKGGLSSIEVAAGILLTVAVIGSIGNELLTDAKTKDQPESDGKNDKDVFFYYGVRRTTKRGIKMALPVFLVAFLLNMFLPTTRDAVVIAGGYGLVEAVKNERVQRLFSKSANVASQWLDEQLNGDEKKKAAEKKEVDEKAAKDVDKKSEKGETAEADSDEKASDKKSEAAAEKS